MIYLEKFLNFLYSVPDPVAYLFLGISAFVENVFPPIPGDLITAFGAFLVGSGKLNFLGVYAVTTAGSLLGFMTLFKIGGYLGRRFFLDKNYWFLRSSTILKAEKWFISYGYLLVAGNRFLPGVRSAVSLAGGICHLKESWVALLALVSCALWNLLWILAGYLLGSNWTVVEAKVSALILKVNAAVLIIMALFIIFWMWRRRFVRK